MFILLEALGCGFLYGWEMYIVSVGWKPHLSNTITFQDWDSKVSNVADMSIQVQHAWLCELLDVQLLILLCDALA